MNMSGFKPQVIYEKVLQLVFGAMLIIITLGIIIGTARLFFGVLDIFSHPGVTGRYREMISDVLTLFILIELTRSLVDYFYTHRLRMTFIVDAGIVFVLREIMINLFEHKISTPEIYALSTLMLVLTALRIGSILVSQQEQKVYSLNKASFQNNSESDNT
jgi:uncharacterized membrane protein (DUF373 family)